MTRLCVHTETPTGIHQPLEHIGQLWQQHEALYIVNIVTSLGEGEVDVDAWHIDVRYSAT